jgi:hypothetical protein
MPIVKWFSNASPDPVEIEKTVLEDPDEIVSSCRERLKVMRRHERPNTPNGFVVVNGAGAEVRRWFEAVDVQSKAILR